MDCVPEFPGPKIDDQLCGRIIRSAAICFGHLVKERRRAVNLLSGGELDQMAEEAARETCVVYIKQV